MERLKVKYTFFLLMFGFLTQHLYTQEFPPIETYTPKQYDAENQNWEVSQSKDKTIYVANDKGLLEFNGAKWKLYESPNKSIMRSVHVVNDHIYTGSYMEFGFWKKNEFGELMYTSLTTNLTETLVEDEQFWSIIGVNNWVLFQSLNRIYVYNTKDSSFKIIESNTRLTDIFNVNGTIYFQKLNDGIYKIENGIGVLVSDHNLVKDNIVVNIFSYKNKLLIETQEKGFHFLDNNEIVKWNIPANEILNNLSVYSSIQLKDKSFILGTISHGIIHMSANGEISKQINQNNGLSNNTVLSLFEDVDNNIWLGLDNGINCININSPFSIFTNDIGDLGTVYASAFFKDNLYLGTNQGLFYRAKNANNAFQFIQGTKGQVWCLEIINDTLFCGHNTGTMIIDDNKVLNIDNTAGTWNIQAIDGDSNLLLQGKYDGLNILEYDGTWKFRNKVEGFSNASRFVEQYKNHEIFVNHEYKGVLKISMDQNYGRAIKIVKDSTAPEGLHSSLLKYKDELLYCSEEGIFTFEESRNGFKRDSIYSKLMDDQMFISGKLVSDDSSTKLWNFTNRNINYLSPGKLSDVPRIKTIALPSSLRNSKTGYENITHLVEEQYLFGTSSGYIIIDLNKLSNQVHEISINSVTKNVLNEAPIRLNKHIEGEFNNQENNIEFNYSVPEFQKYLEVQYQYQLVGIYDYWSNWEDNSNQLFKNLPYGDYTFKVQARVGNIVTNNVASYQFSIAKPWHLSNTAMLFYILIVTMVSFVTHNVYKRYYSIQREKLLEKTERELDLKKMENEQQLMSFKNEKLQNDIDSKNRELAISTMSLIKKNEFLNNIKEELKSINKTEGINPVIKIIDTNLNNTDDWKLFEEAFNNADKDFLKKVKTKHTSLTSNDLRLCAYLRLNLSSKEIAPLLNISPRSVEVKRYRLRKKMELPHEASLTNYILDL